VASLGGRLPANDRRLQREASNEAKAQKQIDRIAVSAECGRYQVSTQLGALRLSAAQLVIRRERPLSECERLLGADRRVEWRRE
jgi:hypothetical protein